MKEFKFIPSFPDTDKIRFLAGSSKPLIIWLGACVLCVVYGCLVPASRLPPIQPIEAEHILKEALRSCLKWIHTTHGMGNRIER